jgi:hypothetical protein
VPWSQFVIPGLYNFLDLPDIACLSVPRSLYLAAFEKEPAFPASDADDAFGRAARVYEMADHSDSFLGRKQSDAACVSRQMLAESLRWFRRWC